MAAILTEKKKNCIYSHGENDRIYTHSENDQLTGKKDAILAARFLETVNT